MKIIIVIKAGPARQVNLRPGALAGSILLKIRTCNRPEKIRLIDPPGQSGTRVTRQNLVETFFFSNMFFLLARDLYIFQLVTNPFQSSLYKY